MRTLLVEKRKQANVSRKDLAVFLGISLSMVEKVEKGTRTASPTLAKKWGHKVGVPDSQLFRYFFDEQSDNISGEPDSAA